MRGNGACNGKIKGLHVIMLRNIVRGTEAAKTRDWASEKGRPDSQEAVIGGMLASIPFFACEMGAVEPYKRGFFCHDESISYPYEENESISDGVLISGGILITAVSIALGESYRVHYLKVESKAFVSNHYISTLYKEIGSFLFGCTVGQSLTNMAKLTIGRLRPNFLTVCKPLVNCSIGQYVDNYSCTGNASLEKEARKSFYSGHASFAMYTMLYLAALYISPMFKKKERCQGKTGNILDSPVSSQHTVC
ncbi:PLPP3 phosphatase, partial [Polypterus senegalus]|nr:PLPP3 phosphatase [Polypterus senegalus]